jgi:hypothetical protein
MNDFEELMRGGTTVYAVQTETAAVRSDSSIQKADKGAAMTDLIQMISKLVTLTMKDINVEFLADDKRNDIIRADVQTEKNYITYLVKSRTPKGELKPRIREEISENAPRDEEGRLGEVYGQKFATVIQFNCMASDAMKAEEIMERFEELIQTYTGYLKKNGIAEILFKEQVTDENYSILRQNLSVRNIRYYVETERLTVIFKEKIKEVEIFLSQ